MDDLEGTGWRRVKVRTHVHLLVWAFVMLGAAPAIRASVLGSGPLKRTLKGPLRRSRPGRWLAYSCVASLAASAALAQDNLNEKRGFDAESLYSIGEIDTVNLLNVGLSMVIPIGNRYPLSTADE